jgi:hypothetical protein
MRGRLAGTNDTGHLFLVPYNQINYVGVQKALKEAEVAAIYAGTYLPATETPSQETAAPAEKEATQPEVEQNKPQEPAPAPTPVREKMKATSKVVLLERVRARLAAQAGKGKS